MSLKQKGEICIIDKYINRLITEGSPAVPLWNMERTLSGKEPHWNYIDGSFLISLWNLYQLTGDEKYAKFADEFVDYHIDDNGMPLLYKIDTYNLDNICMGRVLFDVYEYSKREKYLKTIDILVQQLDKQPRTSEGNYWHKLIYPNNVWLDGLYMAQVFRTRYALKFDLPEVLNDICKQFETVRLRMFDNQTGLYRHAYDEKKSIFWADKKTGQSPHVWLRSMGWFMMAMADIISYLPPCEIKEKLTKLLVELLTNLKKYADKETGMYYQVPDLPRHRGNYLESSGSSMVAYTMLKAARLGLVGGEFRLEGLRNFKGICEKYLTEKDGKLNLGGICLSAGLGPATNTRRNGSFQYYMSEPVVENDAKGVAPFLMCYVETLMIKENT